MWVISQKPLREFSIKYPDAESPLASWFKLAKKGRYSNFSELKKSFGSVDMVPVVRHSKTIDFYVFNIGGNKYRLITTIHFNTQMLFVRYILTHAVYDAGKWKR